MRQADDDVWTSRIVLTVTSVRHRRFRRCRLRRWLMRLAGSERGHERRLGRRRAEAEPGADPGRQRRLEERRLERRPRPLGEDLRGAPSRIDPPVAHDDDPLERVGDERMSWLIATTVRPGAGESGDDPWTRSMPRAS